MLCWFDLNALSPHKDKDWIDMNELKKRSIPWYEQFDAWNSLACKYMRAYLNVASKDEKYDVEFKNFQDFSLMKLVFESNLIEGAGMTLSNTEKVINKYFPKIPGVFYEFRKQFRGNDIYDYIYNIDWEKIVTQLSEENKLVKLSYIFSQRSKDALEVLQHSQAITKAMLYTTEYTLDMFRYRATLELKKVKKVPKN
jgi:hypothetical protein